MRDWTAERLANWPRRAYEEDDQHAGPIIQFLNANNKVVPESLLAMVEKSKEGYEKKKKFVRDAPKTEEEAERMNSIREGLDSQIPARIKRAPVHGIIRANLAPPWGSPYVGNTVEWHYQPMFHIARGHVVRYERDWERYEDDVPLDDDDQYTEYDGEPPASVSKLDKKNKDSATSPRRVPHTSPKKGSPGRDLAKKVLPGTHAPAVTPKKAKPMKPAEAAKAAAKAAKAEEIQSVVDEERAWRAKQEAEKPKPKPRPTTERRKIKPDRRYPYELGCFLAVFDCVELHNPDHVNRRSQLYNSFDNNGNGYISLSETGGAILQELCKHLGEDGNDIYKRFYRSYIRAWADAKDAKPQSGARSDLDDEYVTRKEFRLLLVYLRLYATWLEVFKLIDVDQTSGDNLMGAEINTRGAHVMANAGYLEIEVPEGDNRISREEWNNAVREVRKAGRTWAPFIALKEATEETFDEIDQNGGGHIDLQEFCEWIEKAEKEAGTSFGVDLGVNEPIDRAANNARKWFTSPLETRAVKRGGEKGGAAKQKVGMNRIEELKAQIANQRKVRESDAPFGEYDYSTWSDGDSTGGRHPKDIQRENIRLKGELEKLRQQMGAMQAPVTSTAQGGLSPRLAQSSSSSTPSWVDPSSYPTPQGASYPYVTTPQSHAALAAYHLASISGAAETKEGGTQTPQVAYHQSQAAAKASAAYESAVAQISAVRRTLARDKRMQAALNRPRTLAQSEGSVTMMYHRGAPSPSLAPPSPADALGGLAASAVEKELRASQQKSAPSLPARPKSAPSKSKPVQHLPSQSHSIDDQIQKRYCSGKPVSVEEEALPFGPRIRKLDVPAKRPGTTPRISKPKESTLSERMEMRGV